MLVQRLVSLLLGASLVGCGEDPPPQRPKVPVVSGPIVEHSEAAAGVSFASVSFPCCSSAELTATVGAYVGLGEALAADDAAAASERAGVLATTLGALPADTAGVADMVALTGRMAGKDLEGTREEFLDLTTPMLALAKGGKANAGALTIAVAYCPMKPGRWLQAKDGITNPYFGAGMLTCGVFEAP